MPVITDIADAVAAELNGNDFGTPLTAVRSTKPPEFELADMKELRVTVVPRGWDSQTATRAATQCDYQIDIGVQKKVANGDNPELDALTDIREYVSGNWGGPLTTIASNTCDMQDGLWQVRDYLSGYSYGPLTDIRDCLWADGYNAAWWMKEAAYRGSDALMYLGGGWNGPLTDIAWSNYEIRDQINGYSYGPLSDMRDRLSAIEQYLWNGWAGQSAADILGDIRNVLNQLTFDGNGNLRVVTY
jgi:hypothetical protein